MLGALISGGAALLGGLFNRNSQESTNAANIQMQRETNAQNLADKEKDRELQKEFAQSGIQWKASDALKAGIHPLYAMGANTTSYASSPIGLTSPKAESSDAMGNAISSAGQDISRAAAATSTTDTKDADTAMKLALTKAGLENELLATQIAKQRGQIGPSIPKLISPGGNPIKDKALEQTAESLPETRGIRLAGIPLRTNPYSSDAESVENRYGNTAEAIGGAVNIPLDLAYTLYKDYPHILAALGGNYATRKYQEQRRKPGYRPGLE